MTQSCLNIVNVVGGGNLNKEVDLLRLSSDFETPVSRYDPEHHPSLILKLHSDGATIMLFRTGSYNIAGASSVRNLWDTNEEFLNHFRSLDDEIDSGDGDFEVRNVVFKSKLDVELDLSALTVGLGLDNAEYEPEQFPGVLYRPPSGKGAFLIFRTGSVLLTGAPSEAEGSKQMAQLEQKLSQLGVI